MSSEYCSIFVVTVLILQIITFFHAQTAPITPIARYQVNFRRDSEPELIFVGAFSNTQRYNLKKLA